MALRLAEQLHNCVLKNNVEGVTSLIASGADVNDVGFGNISPLHRASEKGFVEIAAILIDAKANVEAVNRDGMRPLQLAIRHNHVDLVALLVAAGCRVTQQSPSTDSALHLAVMRGADRIASLLIEARADIEAVDARGETPLLTAIRHGKEETALLLVEAGADPNAVSPDRGRVLSAAIDAGMSSIALTLISSGRCEALTSEPSSALHRAIGRQLPGVVDALLRSYPLEVIAHVINATDAQGKTPMAVAISNRDEAMAKYLARVAGVDLARALTLAIEANCVSIVEMLLDLETAVLPLAANPLDQAVMLGFTAIAELLLKAGCPTDTANDHLPLITSARTNNTRLVALLLNHGADTDRRDNEGSSLADQICDTKQPGSLFGFSQNVLKCLAANGISN